MTKILSAALLLAAAFMMTGCSAFRSNPQSLTVESNVKDAEVYINGEIVGKTPCKTDVKADWNGAELSVKKETYKPFKKQIGSSLSDTGILDAVGTFFLIFPVIGLAFDGAWDLETHTINVDLVKEK